MRKFLTLALCVANLLRASQAIVVPIGLDNSNQDLSTTVETVFPSVRNASNTPAEIDPKFQVLCRRGSIFLPAVSIYLNSIRLMGSQLLQDLNADLPDGNIKTSQYPWNDVVITSEPLHGTTYPRRYLIWGIFGVLRYFLTRPPVDAVFFFRYDNSKPIALLRYSFVQKFQGNATVSMNATDSFVENDVANKTTQLQMADNDLFNNVGLRPIVSPSYIPRGQEFAMASVFLAIGATLIRLSEHDPNSSIPGFAMVTEPIQYVSSLEYVGKTTTLSKANVIAVIWDLVRFMTSQDVYKEIEASVFMDNERVAKVSLKCGPNPATSAIAPPGMDEFATS